MLSLRIEDVDIVEVRLLGTKRTLRGELAGYYSTPV